MTIIHPEPNSRLHALIAEYDRAKLMADEATERLTSLKDGIKAELSQAAPGDPSVVCACACLRAPLRLVASHSRRLDTKTLKAEIPEIYNKYTVESTVWKLLTVTL